MDSLAALASRHCTPLKGPTHRIGPDRAATLIALLPGWSLSVDGESIGKSFRFTDYYRTLAFVNALAFVAHAEDHHPDLGVFYDRVDVRYSTHDVGGLSENDFICAARAEHLVG